MKRICIINPITTLEFEEGTKREVAVYSTQDVKIEVITVTRGPASIECRFDEALAVPGVLEKVKEVEAKSDAIVVNCFGDPGVEAAREITRVPVIGPGETSMLLATLYGHRFSVVTVLDRLAPIIEDITLKAGIRNKLASVRAAGIPVLDLEKDLERLTDVLAKEAVYAVEQDGAHVIVLGCTGMAGLGNKVNSYLREKGYDVPVIDPVAVSIKVALLSATLELTHSGLTYPAPPDKPRVW